jgi:hypothetical protein
MFREHEPPIGFWQLPDALQVFGAEQVSSVMPLITLLQAPEPHETQVVSQAVSQQTPSVGQKPLTHWPPDAQPCPFTFLQPPLPSHAWVPKHAGAMSVPFVGISLHIPTLPARSHAWQVPVHAMSQQTPSAQKLLWHSPAVTHGLPMGNWQLPAPSQAFGAEHVPVSVCPMRTFEHVPRLPATLHALQVAVQVVLQQRPSTQLALWHSLPAPHVCPFTFLQTPMPSQTLLGALQVPGSGVLASTFEHVPRLPATLHALQTPVQVVLQQRLW